MSRRYFTLSSLIKLTVILAVFNNAGMVQALEQSNCNFNLMQPSSSQEMMATCETATVTVNTNHSEPKPTSECKLTGPTWLWQVSVTIDPDGPGPQSAVNVPYQDVLYQVDTSIPLPSPPSTSSSLAFDFHPHGIGCWRITYEVTG